MRQMKRTVLYLTCLLALAACSSEQSGQKQPTSHSYDAEDLNFPVEIRHAKGFTVANHEGYKEVVVFVPDAPTDTLAHYILYPRQAKPQIQTSAHARFIPVPARSLGCLSTTEIGVLPILDLRHVLVACGDVRNINDSLLRERVEQGEIVQIGRGMSRDVEQIIAARPEVLMQNFADITDKDEDIVASGIEIVLFNNWKEQSLLGRAEWLKMIGMLFARNQVADEAFKHIEEQYLEAKRIVEHDTEFIPIMYGQDYKGAWYVPGEYSYVTTMFRDARVRYDSIPGQVANQPVSFEHVFSRHRHAKIWICMMTGKIKTMEDFLSLNDRYGHFDAAKTGQVWVDRKRVNEYGGNDFWESGPYHPHLLLKDLIKISRPHLLPDYETTYWMELKR